MLSPAPLIMAQPTVRPEDPFGELCLAAMDGDQVAFTRLHDRLGGGIRNLFLQRTGQADIAEDLCQRTWSAFWQAIKAGKYDPGRAAVSTFLYAIGTKIWLQHLRTTRRAARRNAEWEPIEDIGGPNPVDAMGSGELLQAVRDCLAGAGDLTEEDRWLVRSVAAGETDRSLAKRLGVSPSTANARKRAAFDKVRRHLAALGHRENGERSGPEDE
jgi:RNA polymerase sigma factor (sigma-70 family)